MAIIITRHSGLVEWLKLHGIEGDVISHVSNPEQVANMDVIGALPFHLAALANSVTVIDMPNLTPEQRSKDLTVEEMNSAGANLRRYTVRAM
jgi:putative CRISPR-associated protein (TIGR02620 family)